MIWIHHTKNSYVLPSKHKPIPALLNSSVSSSHFLIFTFSEGTIFNQESLSSFLFLHCCNIESSSHFSWEDAYRFTVSLNPLIRKDDVGLLRTNIKWRHYMEWEYMKMLHSQLFLPFFIDHIIVHKWTSILKYTQAFKFLFFMFFSKLLNSNTIILDRLLLSHEQNFHKNLIPWKIKFCPTRKLHLKDNECIDLNIIILITWTRCTYWICLSG